MFVYCVESGNYLNLLRADSLSVWNMKEAEDGPGGLKAGFWACANFGHGSKLLRRFDSNAEAWAWLEKFAHADGRLECASLD